MKKIIFKNFGILLELIDNNNLLQGQRKFFF